MGKIASVRCKVGGKDSNPKGLLCAYCQATLFTFAGFWKRTYASAIDWMGLPLFLLASAAYAGSVWDLGWFIIFAPIALIINAVLCYVSMRKSGNTWGRLWVGGKLN